MVNVKMKFWESTGAKIIFTTIFLLFMIASVAEFYIMTYKRTEDQYEMRLRETGEQLSGNISMHMNTSLSFIESMAEIFSSYDDIHSKEALDSLKRAGEKSEFSRMWLTKANGEAISSEGVSSNALGREYFEEALRGKSGISDVQYSRVNGKKNVVIYAPIYNGKSIQGMLIGIYELDSLSGIVDMECFEGEGYSHIFKQDGEVIVFSNHQDVEMMSSADNLMQYLGDKKLKGKITLESIKENLNHYNQGIIAYVSGEREKYAYYCPVGINDWFVLVNMPNRIIDNDMKENTAASIKLSLEFLLIFLIWAGGTYAEKSRKLHHMAQTDSMTELLNRGAIEKRINEILRESASINCAMMLFDIDRFKLVNDTRGHIAGDELIRKIACLMKCEFRKADVLGRLGGDEFVIFLRDIENREMVYERAEDFLSKTGKISDDELGVSISMGVAITPMDGTNFDDLYKMADKRMYQAKEQGGNCMAVS